MSKHHARSAAAVHGVSVKTALGADTFQVRSFHFRDRLGEPFEGVLELQSADEGIDLGAVLGLPVTVTTSLPQGGERFFNGIVLEASHEGDGHDANHYRLVMGPWLRLLELGSDCRIYQQKSVKDILESVFRGLGFTSFDDAGLIGNYDPLAFCVQYNETHARFVHRLMQRFGIAYHHDHTADSHKLVLCDSHTSYGSSSGYASVPYCSDARTAKNREHVSHWTSIRRIRSGKYAAKDYDYQQPSAAMLTRDSAEQSFPHGDMELFAYPGGYTEQSVGNALARIRIEEQACLEQRFEGTAHCWGFAVGKTFTLTDHPSPDCNQAYLTTAFDLSVEAVLEDGTASHRSGSARQFTHLSRLEAIPANVNFRPAQTAPQPRIAGVQTAVVVGPAGHDPAIPFADKDGSVKLQFRWDRYGKNDDKSSAWVRCSQFWAGPDWGAVFLPRLGCEVAVAFEAGDPDRPLVIGSLYNGDNRPPLSLPDDAQKLILKDDGGNYLEFNPAAGKQTITVYSPADQTKLTIGKI